MPESELTSQITLVGFAPGSDPANPGLCCNGWSWSIEDFDSDKLVQKHYQKLRENMSVSADIYTHIFT